MGDSNTSVYGLFPNIFSSNDGEPFVAPDPGPAGGPQAVRAFLYRRVAVRSALVERNLVLGDRRESKP